MKLRDYLDATDRRAAQFAEDLGVADNTVRRWLNGTRTPSVEQMRAIYQATRGLVQPNDLVLQ
ncbi:MAG: putative antitoxin of bacterial toxin-antitoxin system, YdaS/YdaT [Pseudomonadota bacterium]|jgi:transcriptional regulator with XRE-family HTH domain